MEHQRVKLTHEHKKITEVPPHGNTPSTSHYCDAIMGTVASQITSLRIVYTAVYSDADQSKHQRSASLAFVWGIHRGPVNSPHKWPVTRKMFPFDDVIIVRYQLKSSQSLNVTVWIELQYVLGGCLPHSDTRIRHHGAAFFTPCKGNSPMTCVFLTPWWRYQMETFSTLLALCAGN